MGNSRSRDASAGHGGGAHAGSRTANNSAHPQIRCYTCSGIFMTTQPAEHVRCPYCSTINGVSGGSAGPSAQGAPSGQANQAGASMTAASANALAAQLAAAGQSYQ